MSLTLVDPIPSDDELIQWSLESSLELAALHRRAVQTSGVANLVAALADLCAFYYIQSFIDVYDVFHLETVSFSVRSLLPCTVWAERLFALERRQLMLDAEGCPRLYAHSVSQRFMSHLFRSVVA